MATTRRDIELLISAKETTGRSFKQVTANIDALNAKIGQQIAQAERGEISLQELRQTQEQLAQAGRDLSSIQGQIDAYNRLVATSDKVGAAASKAQADLAALKAEIEQAGQATARQEQKMQRLENAVTRTSAAVEKNRNDLTQQVAVLERAGIATDKLDTAQVGVVNSARNIGAGLSQVNAAIDGYSSNVARARQEEANLAAQQGFERKISEAQRLGQASRFVQLFGEAIRTVKTEENQLAALSGFRAVGQMASEASRDLSRFVEVGQSMSASTSQVAAGLRSLIDPAGAALQTLSGVEAAIEKADAAATENVKNVGLLNDAYNQLTAAGAALLRQGSLIDQFEQQAAATGSARAQFEQAQAEVQRLGQAMQQAETPTEQLANALRQAETRLEQTGRELSSEETKLGLLSRELKQAGLNTADLATEQARLEGAATRVNGAVDRINTTLGRGGRRTTGLFGLKPNDLANLNFQIQDIFVSLQAGQSPLTVFIQQGSQISQIFPGLISTVAKLTLRFFPLIAAAAGLGAAFVELYTDSVRLQQAQEDLANIPTGDALDPARFAAAQEKLEDMGQSAEDARLALLALAEEGFDQDQLDRYSEAAARLAERLQVDLAEATQLLISVQKGGIDSVLDLTEKTNDLTEADLEHAEALFEAGRAAEARQFVLDRVAERNDQIARSSESQWTPAVDNLKTAVTNLFTEMARIADVGGIFSSFFDSINRRIDSAIVGFTFLTGLLAGKGVKGAQEDAFEVIRRQRGLGPNLPPGATDQQIRDRRFIQQLDEQELQNRKALTAEQRLQIAAQKARNQAQAAGVSQAVEERAVQQAIALEQRKISEEAERANKRSSAAASRARRAAEAEERKRQSALRQLEGQLRQLNRAAFTGVSATLEERLTAIDEKYESIVDSLQKVRDLGLTQTPDGIDLATVEAQVAATKARLKDEETIKFFQEQAALLDKQRSAELERIADAQERGAVTTAEAMLQAQEVASRLSPQIVDAAQKALSVARAIAGTNPSPEMVSWIASLERIISGEARDRSVADIGLAGLDAASSRLNQLLTERDNLVRSYQVLNELGLQTDAQTRELTAQAYERQAASIAPVLAQLREQVELLHNTIDPLTNLPVITDTAYNAWLAKLEEVNAGLANIDPRLQQINAAVSGALQQGIVTAFNSIAQSIVGVISGTESFGDALKNLGSAALGIFASIVDAIAQVLVQLVALQIAKSILGASGAGGFSFLFHDGGLVGGRGASRQTRTNMGSWFGAPKFHDGGGLGLRPDEYKAVLKRGEEVLTEDDPRHIRNLGSGAGSESSGGGMSVKQVLLLDPEAVPNAMQTRAGQKSVLTVIRQNKETIKQVLG